jgi:hypothetical protein
VDEGFDDTSVGAQKARVGEGGQSGTHVVRHEGFATVKELVCSKVDDDATLALAFNSAGKAGLWQKRFRI